MTDEKLRTQIEDYASDLKARHVERDDMFDKMEDVYLLQWDEEAAVKQNLKHVKLTKSPDARNAIVGAVRLMTAADPIIRVPFEQTSPGTQAVSEKIEQACAVMWRAASRVRQDPIHYDIVRSALIYGEIHVAVTSTKDLVRLAAGSSKANIARAERAAAVTPYLYEVFNPRSGYPEWDDLGLRAYYRETEMQAHEISSKFGAAGDRALQGITTKSSLSRFESVTLCDWWDLEWRQIWIKDGDLILQEKHGLPFIPIVCSLVEGTRLFDDEADQREPFLYTLVESGLWNRQNLALTAMYTMVAGMGLNPMFVQEMSPAGGDVELDFSTPGGIVKVPPGSRFYPMGNKGLIDPAVAQSLEIAQQLSTESTIYRQALGEPLGTVAFSYVAMMAQAGRLPLIVSQRKASWVIGDVLRMSLDWMRTEPGSYKVKYGSQVAEIKASDIPEYIEVEVTLDIALPQDKLQNANIAAMLTQGQLASKRWVRENILQIGQSDLMEEEIWTEQAAGTQFGMILQQLQSQAQMAQQAQQQQMQQQVALQGQAQQAQMQQQMAPPQQAPQQAPPGPQTQPSEEEIMAMMQAQGGGQGGNGAVPPSDMAGEGQMI